MSAKRSNSQKQRANSQGKRTNSQKVRTGSQKSRKYSTATSVVSFDIPELFVRHNFEVRTTPYRWPLVFFFAFNITAISCMSLSMSPQSSLLKYAYNVSVQEVNMCSTIFSATYIPMTFVAMWLYSKAPCHYVLRLGCAFFLTGCWIRAVAESGVFWPILLG